MAIPDAPLALCDQTSQLTPYHGQGIITQATAKTLVKAETTIDAIHTNSAYRVLRTCFKILSPGS